MKNTNTWPYLESGVGVSCTKEARTNVSYLLAAPVPSETEVDRDKGLRLVAESAVSGGLRGRVW